MYLPQHFAIDDVERIAEFVDAAGVADIVTFDGAALTSTLVPVIWERPSLADVEAGRYGRLLAHIAIANDQWRTAKTNVPALAIAHGPQAYISPSWYASKREHGRVVPTSNYTTVHLSGPITFHNDSEWLRKLVTRLTELREAHRAQRWHVNDAPKSFIDGQLRGIVGAEINVTALSAKAKLSQNRSAADQRGVVEALRAEPDPQAHHVAALMARNLETQDTK
jgi:transcriptional regulator